MGGDHGNVIILASDGDWAKVMADAAGKKVVVDFTATWCGPCRMIAPFFQELSEKYPGIVFLKVDVDQCEGIAAECGIQAMPTFQVYDSTTKLKVEELVGASKESLEKMIQKYA